MATAGERGEFDQYWAVEVMVTQEGLPQAAGEALPPAVLIADDNAPLRALWWKLLGTGSFRLLMASDGQEALTLARVHHPAVAVLDVHMPELTGLEVARAIKTDPALASTVIILVSGLTSPETAQEARAIGVEHLLPKPFSLVELRGLIEGLLRSPLSSTGGGDRDG